jgi:hypothetical protein
MEPQAISAILLAQWMSGSGMCGFLVRKVCIF